jgi:hypothetical protein
MSFPRVVTIGRRAYGPGEMEVEDRYVDAAKSRGATPVSKKSSGTTAPKKTEPAPAAPGATGAADTGTGGTNTDNGGTGAATGNVGTPLPNDFPGREALETAGLSTLEEVRDYDGDYDTIAGIGKSTEEKIVLAIRETFPDA